MENKVLAIVNGNEITEKDLDYTISRVPRERQEMFKTEEGKKELLNQIISFELVYLDAKDKKVDEDAQYLANLETAKKEILTQIAINKILSDVKIEDEEIEKFYNENKDRFKAEATVRAKHILVDNEELALNIKKEVAEGLSFEEAAKKYSSCPSKEKGGDLGEFPKGAMVKEFEDAAFTLPLGTVSEPVKTQFGFHLILVVDKNEGSMKEIEEVKGQIFEEMMQKKQSEKYLSYVEDLKSKYKAEVK